MVVLRSFVDNLVKATRSRSYIFVMLLFERNKSVSTDLFLFL
jgi:hypothetical protein